MRLGKPARNLRSAPKPAVIRRHLDPLFELCQRLGGEDCRFRSVMNTLIPARLGTALIVPFDQRTQVPGERLSLVN